MKNEFHWHFISLTLQWWCKRPLRKSLICVNNTSTSSYCRLIKSVVRNVVPICEFCSGSWLPAPSRKNFFGKKECSKGKDETKLYNTKQRRREAKLRKRKIGKPVVEYQAALRLRSSPINVIVKMKKVQWKTLKVGARVTLSDRSEKQKSENSTGS